MTLLHIIDALTWEAARKQAAYSAPSLETEGFIHLSTPEQVLLPANLFYRAQTGLLLLVIAPDKLTAPLRFDSVPGHGVFPHLYGPLNTDAVITTVPFEPQSDGTFVLPLELPVAG